MSTFAWEGSGSRVACRRLAPCTGRFIRAQDLTPVRRSVSLARRWLARLNFIPFQNSPPARSLISSSTATTGVRVMRTFGIPDLARRIKQAAEGDCPYTLFLGAGASTSSGIVTAQGMVKQWKLELLHRQNPIATPQDIEKWLRCEVVGCPDALHECRSGFIEWWQKEFGERISRETEYPRLFTYMAGTPSERQLCIERIIDGKEPGFGYLYLAALVAQRRFDTILTTNFDDLLHDTLFRYYDIKPVVCAFDSAVESIRISPRPKIIKLHGDFLYDNIRNVGQEIVRLGANMEEKLKQSCQDRGLVVVGYEGTDASVMVPIQNMLRTSTHLKLGLHWCVWHDRDKGESVISRIPDRVKELHNNYPGRVFVYGIHGFDQLMEEVFVGCGYDEKHLSKLLLSPRKHSLYHRFNKGLIDSGEYAHLGRRYRKADEFLSAFRKAIREDRPSLDTLLDEADELFRTAQRHHKANPPSFDLAIAHLQQSERLTEEAEQSLEITAKQRFRAWRRKTGILVELGDVFRKMQRPAEVKAQVEKTLAAVEHAIQLGDLAAREEKVTVEELRACQYNALAAFGLKLLFDRITADDLRLATVYWQQHQTMDPEGKDSDLLLEPGLADLVDLIKKQAIPCTEPAETTGLQSKSRSAARKKNDKGSTRSEH